MVLALEYGDFQRALLQTIMAYGTMKAVTFHELFVKLRKHFLPQQEIEEKDICEVVEMINVKISRFDQKITTFDYGLTGDQFYVFHSTASTSISKLQNIFNEDELDLFKNILKKVLECEGLTISPVSALNLCTSLPGKITKNRAEKLLDGWIQNHYFFKHRDNQIYLGAKMLSEFKELLQGLELDNLKSCLLCESIAIWGDRCANCGTIYHSSCIRKFVNRTEKCPSCKEKWAVAVNN